jgi:hypothetical protein
MKHHQTPKLFFFKKREVRWSEPIVVGLLSMVAVIPARVNV